MVGSHQEYHCVSLEDLVHACILKLTWRVKSLSSCECFITFQFLFCACSTEKIIRRSFTHVFTSYKESTPKSINSSCGYVRWIGSHWRSGPCNICPSGICSNS